MRASICRPASGRGCLAGSHDPPARLLHHSVPPLPHDARAAPRPDPHDVANVEREWAREVLQIMSRHYWTVLIPQRFDAMEFENVGPFPASIKIPAEPYRYLPIFESREAAIAWNGGRTSHVAELREVGA